MFDKYKYIYPPRPEKKISPNDLSLFDNGRYLAQPKLNGSCMEVYTNGKELAVMNRHKKPLTCHIDKDELKSLHRGQGWIVLCGEYMNKGQTDENNKKWSDNFVIFDILVHNSKHLKGTTFEQRFELLETLYPSNPVKLLIHSISPNCYRVDSVYKNFERVFTDITQYQMYEGLVMKSINGKLELGTTQRNNTRTQIKCRKSTKNYAF